LALPKESPGIITVNGPIPVIDQLTAKQGAQPATVTVDNKAQQDLAGQIITEYRQNDFCESIGELKLAGLEVLRDLNAVTVDFDMPIDCLTEEGQTVAVSIPELGGLVNTIAWQSDQAFNGDTAANNQHIMARFYPPELAA